MPMLLYRKNQGAGHLKIKWLMVSLTLMVATTAAAYALDQSPMSSFRFGNKRLTGAYVKSVTSKGVEVVGSDERGRSASIVVPLGEAEKMASLQMRVRKEIELIRKKAADELRAEIDRHKANPGDEQGFDTYTKTPEGWVVYVCELERTMISAGVRSAAQRVGMASGEYRPPSYKTEWAGGNQMALLRFYKNPAAEGERIVTRVEKGPPREIEVDGMTRTLRTYEVVGNDRREPTDRATERPPRPAQPGNVVTETASITTAEQPKPATDVVILSATYGAEGVYKYVAKLVADKLATALTFRVGNGELGGDPIFGKVKELRVKYAVRGKTTERTFREGEQASFD